jgi:hypothetical protein
MCLLHIGAVHRTSNWLEDIIRELEGAGLSAVRIDANPDSIAELIASDAEGEVLCIDDLRGLLNTDFCAEVLQRMRPALIEARHKGWRVLLVSTVPPDLYPALAGSSILVDASLVQGRPMDEGAAARYVRNLGVVDEISIMNLVDHAGGSRALLEAFASIELSVTSGNAKKSRAEATQKRVAGQTFDEIGSSLCMWLEHWVFESGREELYESDIATNFLIALRSAGVLAPAKDDAFTIFPYRSRELWTAVLGDYLESVVEPPALWQELVSELFAFERELRSSIKSALVEAGMLESALAPYRDRILELARRDSVPAAADLNDVRSPLDWLTLSDLLRVAQEFARPRMCGYAADRWDQISREMVPIRNRVAHMRLARQGDLEAVRRCRRLWKRVSSLGT